MNQLSDFTNLFKRTITLRFKLEPVSISKGKIVTLQKSPYDELRTNDEQLQSKYECLKPAIDAYHRYYIDAGLKKLLIQPCVDKYGEVTPKGDFIQALLSLQNEKELSDEQTKKLRTFVVECLTKDNVEKFDILAQEKFLSNTLKAFVADGKCLSYFNGKEEDVRQAQEILSQKDSKLFSNCSGLLDARALMYGIDGKSISVAYRSISVNYPKFLSNIRLFKRATQVGAVDIEALNKDFANVLLKMTNLCGYTISSVEQLFDPLLYPCFMIQEGIDMFNTIIGRERERQESAGINQSINEYNQRVKNSKKKNKESELKTLPLMKKLFDQILFGNGLFIPQLEDYTEVKPHLKQVIASLEKLHAFDGRVSSNIIYSLLQSLRGYREDGIFVSAKSVSNISNVLWDDWSILYDAVKRDKNGKIKQKSISLKQLGEFVDSLKLDEKKNIYDYFEACRVKDVANENKQTDLFNMLSLAYSNFRNANIMRYGSLDDDQLYKLEQLMDAIMSLRRFISIFGVGTYEEEADGAFYKRYADVMSELRDIEYRYNLIRNFFRRKPFNQDKIQIHFGKSNLLGNWPEQDKKGTFGNAYLFRVSHNGQPDYEYDYYLGIGTTNMFSGKGEERQDRDVFHDKLKETGDLSVFERYYYYQMQSNTFKGQNYKNANNMFPSEADHDIVDLLWNKCSSVENMQKDLDELEKGKTDALSLLNLISRQAPELLTQLHDNHIFVELYKGVLKRWEKAFAKAAKRIAVATQYAEAGFDHHSQINAAIDVVCNTKVVEFIPVSQKEITKTLAEEVNGKPNKNRLFLFRITNKDFSYAQTMSAGNRKSRGNENLHTMYFRALMDTAQTTFDIGSGQVFFRKASDKKRLKYNEKNPTHKANEPIDCKNLVGETRTFGYDLVKDKHFTKDTYLFHLSIFQNYNPSMAGGLNANVRDYLVSTNEDVHVIGIDRGERNLIYIVLLDRYGNIVDQMSFNELGYTGINAKKESFTITTNYHDLLASQGKKMKEQQKHWQAVDNITDLKRGYLSIVVHKLAKLIVEKHAIVVMEDLNQGFMTSRQNQMANVYQEFENMLESKLSYLVQDKKMDSRQPGGLYNGFQLAQKDFNGQQNGFLFYVPAWMTSKIDPMTGFVNLFTFSYTNREKAKAFFSTFKSIRYNKALNEYEFCFRYADFAKQKVTQKVACPDIEWTACTNGSRIERIKKNSGYEYNPIVNLTDKFTELFMLKGIDIYGDIQDQIKQLNDAELYSSLVHLFKLMMQMRNTSDEADYIISPVRNPSTDNQYDSRNYKDSNEAPQDADANGAYNIARKGLMALKQLREGQANFKITNEQWLIEAQSLMISNTND